MRVSADKRERGSACHIRPPADGIGRRRGSASCVKRKTFSVFYREKLSERGNFFVPLHEIVKSKKMETAKTYTYDEAFDNTNPKLLEAFKVMDGENGGNIIACGHIKGTYTHGE